MSAGPVQRAMRVVLGPDATAANWGWLCLVSALGLSAIGVLAIDLAAGWSAPEGGAEPAGARSGLSPLALKQAAFVAVGVLAALVVAIPHSRLWRRLAWVFLALSVASLVFLLLPFVPESIVTPRKGVRGWVNLGVFDLQPAELARIAFVLATAEWLRFSRRHRSFAGLLPPGIIAGVPIALIFLQPDLGMASLFVPSLFAMLLVAGAKPRHLIIVVTIGAMAAPAAYTLLKPYQKQRIAGLISQFRGERHTADDLNYQAYTAQMLIGAGGVAGYEGERARAVVHFAELPERHNDMILAVIVARWGLLGGLLVLALSGLWVAGAVLTALSARDPFGRIVCVGLAATIAAQVFINTGMVCGLLPIVGLTLPFVSAGGSSMVSVWIMTGLVFAIAARRPGRMERGAFQFDD